MRKKLKDHPSVNKTLTLQKWKMRPEKRDDLPKVTQWISRRFWAEI